MTAAFFPDDPFAQLVAALLCYAGILLYATSTVVRGFRRAITEGFATLIFVALFPISSGSALLYFLQYSAILIGFVGVSGSQVHGAAMRHREALAYRAGTRAEPIGIGTTLALFAPIAVPAGLLLVEVGAMLLRGPGGLTSSLAAHDARAAVEEGAANVFWIVVLFGVYMLAGSYLDRAWLGLIGRIRLMTSDARFVWINVAMGALSVAGLIVITTQGITSAAARWSLIVVVFAGLLPAINGLRWIYDAVFRRVVAFHLLVLAAAIVLLGMKRLCGLLTMTPAQSWALSIGAVALVAVSAPAWMDRILERWILPRSGETRARLLAIAALPLDAPTRLDAGVRMLESVVDVLGSDGGLIVIEAAATEPLALRSCGRVDGSLLGDTPAEAARYVASLPISGEPCRIENLPLKDQLRLLSCGVTLICPLVGRRREATILLGPRRGRLYEDSTLRASTVFARQAGLALENLALANARAHGEKLAALGGAAARIAHEIRNPLTAARSLVQIMSTAESDGLGEPAIRELDRIGGLVRDLLLFARRDDLQTAETVELPDLCREAVAQLAPLAGDAAVEVETELAPAAVRGDRERLLQALGNLCRNGIEALGEANGRRRLSVRCGAANGAAFLEVSDTGPGITAENLARLFEPFRTTKRAGTGLGLAIARGIVEAHGGRVTAASEPGRETTFRVELAAAGPNGTSAQSTSTTT